MVEKEKLVLSVEQEILRVHGRAARALANQSLPFSVCTILKDEECYNLITPEQEEKDRNARSRYNGKVFHFFHFLEFSLFLQKLHFDDGKNFCLLKTIEFYVIFRSFVFELAPRRGRQVGKNKGEHVAAPPQRGRIAACRTEDGLGMEIKRVESL